MGIIAASDADGADDGRPRRVHELSGRPAYERVPRYFPLGADWIFSRVARFSCRPLTCCSISAISGSSQAALRSGMD